MKRQDDGYIQQKTNGLAGSPQQYVRRRRQVIEIPIPAKPPEAGPSAFDLAARSLAPADLIETDPPTRVRELDARRAAGAEAWSPSRAREALRKFMAPRPDELQAYGRDYRPGVAMDVGTDQIHRLAEAELRSQLDFDGFCAAMLGRILEV